jgi:molybdenum cofactor biosynthesis enzyme MoaA
MMRTPKEASQLRPDREPARAQDSLRSAREVMEQTGQWAPGQQMGRRWAVGCVALEITQRCNLDCSLCYLSEHSEAVHDIPLGEILRRIDLIHRFYGPHTDVQITGGDPTLRQRDELIAIVDRVAALNMRPTLMTNGIKASRELLAQLAAVGLTDVAFHVDTTQGRKNYGNETELNTVREACIEAAAGLGLNIMFNTTIHRHNLHEVPALVRFFRGNARALRLVSFQIHADTGRGTERNRPDAVNADAVWRQIEAELGTTLNRETIRGGHRHCNHYGIAIMTGSQSIDLLDEQETIAHLLEATAQIPADRRRKFRTAVGIGVQLLKKPREFQQLFHWLVGKAIRLVPLIMKERTGPTTLSFVVHNFMDACNLDAERIAACSFKAMTHDGPLSMCLLNAQRDEYILAPLRLDNDTGHYWDPLTGKVADLYKRPTMPDPQTYPLRRLRGRTRLAATRRRRGGH